MLKQFLKDAQLSVRERPDILIINALMGGFFGLVVTAISSDVVFFLNSSQLEGFVKKHAGQFDCAIDENFSIFLPEISCESDISKKALALAIKIYMHSSLYPSPLSAWSIARNVCIGSMIGFALGVDKAKEIGLSNNPNRLFSNSTRLHNTPDLEESTIELEF